GCLGGRDGGAALILALQASELRFNRRVRLGKGLAAKSHHVRNGVDVDGLVFVSDATADVAEFHAHHVVDLALNGEVEGVDDVGPEVRVERLAGRGGDVIDTGEIRLG